MKPRNKYSRIFHHLSIEDVKKRHWENIEVRKIEEQEKKEVEARQQEVDRQKSNWRDELTESDWANITTGNKVVSTFKYSGSGETFTHSAIGGVIPSTTEIGGEIVDAPTESEYDLQGFTPLMQWEMQRKKSKKSTKEINQQLDSSEDYAKRIDADAYMKARVFGDDLPMDRSHLSDTEYFDQEHRGHDMSHGYSLPPKFLDDWATKTKFTGDMRTLWDGKTRTWKLGGRRVDNQGRTVSRAELKDRQQPSRPQSDTEPSDTNPFGISDPQVRSSLGLDQIQVAGPITGLKRDLTLKYLTQNRSRKPFTQKDLSPEQTRELYKQVRNNLKYKGNIHVDGGEVAPAVKNVTSNLSPLQLKRYGVGKGDRIYTVGTYLEKGKPTGFEDLRFLLGNYLVITSKTGRIKAVRDDFDFSYGYGVQRTGSVAGDPYTSLDRVKGKGMGSAEGGGATGEFVGTLKAPDRAYTDPLQVRVGRSVVDTARQLGIGNPVPINIQFKGKRKKKVNESKTLSGIKQVVKEGTKKVVA